MSQKCVSFSKRKDTHLQSLWNKTAPRSGGSVAHPLGNTVSTKQKGTYMAYNCCSQLIF